MPTLRTAIHVDGITGQEIFDFLADPDDRSYQEWWPGTHLSFHPLERHDDHIGDLVAMDEYIGKRRVRMTGVVVEAVPGRKLVWRLKKVVNLPARLTLELADDDAGVTITHTIEAGAHRAARIMDPLLRLYFSRVFADAMDDHVRTEFPRLRDLLHVRRARTPETASARPQGPRATV